MTARLVEKALQAEMTEHLGHEPGQARPPERHEAEEARNHSSDVFKLSASKSTSGQWLRDARVSR
jgi:transposase-like protein